MKKTAWLRVCGLAVVFAWATVGCAGDGQPPSASPDDAPVSTVLLPPGANAGKGANQQIRELLARGIDLFRENHLEEAMAVFQKVVDLDPQNLAGLVNLGLLQYRSGNTGLAEKTLKKAVHIDPDAALPWLTLGIIACEQEQFPAALAGLSQAVLLEPKNPKAHNYLGVVYGKKGWFQPAESELQAAIELDPGYADARFNLAVIYLQQNPPMTALAKVQYLRARDLGAAPDSLVEQQLGLKEELAK